ncbi:RNA polymerase ii subunit a c-terminal domain phosphatase [Anaeramoeba flamelloides]|uniref:RNA polymerase II subunit A C-terminal domain phosphatase n=1 Tax=Anaeramoeba flamelloides TaxID=1746091 RepID=A0AAV8A1E7_9EUKA|nr:RNA polymerase ii subunit a c-terminal domain phosphatase [Anaeramoeba flamelloides]
MEQIPLLFKSDIWDFKQRIKITKWNLKEGSLFDNDTLLFEYCILRKEENYVSSTLYFHSKNEGRIKKIIAKPNTIINYSDELAIIEICPHDIVFDNLCASCGRDLSNNKNFLQKRVSIVHSNLDIKVSKNVVNEITTSQIKRLTTNKKLALILDLDSTLIHTTTLKEDEPIPKTPFEIQKFRLENDPNYYYVCIRPGVRDFLAKISKFYELHIYTMGIKKYAKQIARILDPSGKYFSNRILSRDDCEGKVLSQKNLQRIFPADDSYVLIVDDREDVWVEETEKDLKICENFIQIRPFHYFCTDVEINTIESEKEELNEKENENENKNENENENENENGNGNGNGIQKEKQTKKTIKFYDLDLKKEESHVLLVSRLLTKCQRTFFVSKTKNVKTILADFKKDVLKGSKIWFPFSLFETDVKGFKILFSKALDFGANCYYDWNTEITHTIAIDHRQLDELCEALDKKRPMHFVSPDWIHSSCIKWNKQKEYLFTPNFQQPRQNGNVNLSQNNNNIKINAEKEKKIEIEHKNSENLNLKINEKDKENLNEKEMGRRETGINNEDTNQGNSEKINLEKNMTKENERKRKNFEDHEVDQNIQSDINSSLHTLKKKKPNKSNPINSRNNNHNHNDNNGINNHKNNNVDDNNINKNNNHSNINEKKIFESKNGKNDQNQLKENFQKIEIIIHSDEDEDNDTGGDENDEGEQGLGFDDFLNDLTKGLNENKK